jgi:type IV pilus assembly protein PilY1
VGRAKTGGGIMVYVGTGKYLETGDNNGAAGGVQTFYALHDQGGYTVVGTNPVISGRGSLLEQTVTNESVYNINVDELGTPEDTSDDVLTAFELRETSNNYATLGSEGWFMDLSYGAATGERVVSKPALRGGQVVFVTNIPASDPCSPGGDSWVMKLDAFSGKRLTHTYDLNDDGKFNDIDRPSGGGSTALTGIKVNSGNSPSFMPDGDADKILISTNNGIKILDSYLGQQINRQSWQQITR